MIFRPLNDNIIAEPEKAATSTKSGILLTSGGKREQPRTATVVAVGEKVNKVRVGDRILFQAFATSDLRVGEAEYIAIREEFVIATVGGAESDGSERNRPNKPRKADGHSKLSAAGQNTGQTNQGAASVAQ